MPEISDRTAITIDLKWVILLVGLLISATGSSAVLVYQVSELRQDVATLEASAQKNRDAVISLTATLQAKEIIK